MIALTANAFADDVRACRDAGMDEFISKPMRKKVLIEKLALLLSDHPAVARAAKQAQQGIDQLPVTPAAEVALVDVVPVVDIAVLKCLAEEIAADGVRAALAVFLKDTPDCLALLRRLSCARDRARIKDEAHQLKGAAETFGLCQFAELAKTLELCAPTITLPDFTALLDRLEATFARAREEAAAVVETVLG